ncbi:hypothetical protein KPZU40_52400 [Klebsiella pneumoniae]|nr:hypothetical protein KPZU40_52400 [Klebsiella pneumoniae]
MANFNTLIKRKQYIWLGLILAGGAAAVGGGLYLSDLNMSSDEEAPAQGEPAPDMTGVVDSSFNSKVEQHATTEMQATAADLNKRFDSLQGEVDLLSKARSADQIRIDKLSSDNEAMQNQLKALGVKPAVSGGEPAPTPPSPPPGPEGAAASQLSAANRRRGTASDGILSGEWYDTAAAGQLPVCTGTKPDTA